MNVSKIRLSNRQKKSPKQQGGAVLIVALSLLVILTILGISVMESSVIEERMAGNNLDYNLAFQSAESALREGEQWIAQRNSRPDTVNLPDEEVVLNLNALGNAWWRNQNTAWWITDNNANGNPNTNTFEPAGGAMGELSNLPRFIIEEYDIVCDGAVNDPNASACKVIYRITARGWGRSPSSTVLLQSLYAKRF
ncbi:hypothetical protein KO489_08495 [Reinekea forsetii]|nr:hypothetical protein [Reinekea forsetii]